MPPLSSSSLFNPTITNATFPNPLQVICAFPVSGQYGPGSRWLYYALVAACVVGKNVDWLKNACLAAALLFPAVAAVHALVLASINTNEAIDMDIYGAFQLCSIGILTAPTTIRLSQTYFNDPARNSIFAWTFLILAGLLSLVVSFFRVKTFPCSQDDSGNPLPLNLGVFPYGNATCGLVCTIKDGPYSPLRIGSANNIFVIPAPHRLTSNTCTLIAAACCIPAILQLMSMWDKILDISWKRQNDVSNEPISGTNGATIEKMREVDSGIRGILTRVEIPIVGVAVLAIIIFGELNFFSGQVWYQTEPLAAIGQWAPILGTGLAIAGSLYNLLSRRTADGSDDSNHAGTPPTPEVDLDIPAGSVHSGSAQDADELCEITSNSGREALSEIMPTMSTATTGSRYQFHRSSTSDTGSKRRITTNATSWLTEMAHDDKSAFRRGPATDFPTVPGEEMRNSKLSKIKKHYNPDRDADGNATPNLRERHSRASSFNGSIADGASRESSPQPQAPTRSQSPSRSPTTSRPQHAMTFPRERPSFDLPIPSPGARLRTRRDTLEVPSPVRHSHTRNNISVSSIPSPVTITQSPTSPIIKVSSDEESCSVTKDTASPSEPAEISQITASPPLHEAAYFYSEIHGESEAPKFDAHS